MRILNACFVIVGVFGLVAIRMLEEQLFYDPFLQYFHEADKNAVFPDFEWTKLIVSYIFRFLLNLFFSVMIIYFMFKNKIWTFHAAVLIAIVFVITLPIYLYCIHTRFEVGYLFSFYMRRFVIQPLTLLLVIPLFYYRKEILKKTAV